MMRSILIGILILLTACSSIALQPTYELVEKAIAIQLEQTQQQLTQKLDLDFQKFEIKQVVITQEEPLTIEYLPAYHVQGTYDLTVKLPKKQITQPQKPFDIYLQIQREGKSWRLLLPEKTNNDKPSIWHSYQLMIDN
ncbi:MAG: hypothetical protein VKL60_01950 [Sphaerospermopsis sp.]|nr:hypothetical protein [Sphaerospermopsis sp.]